MAEFTEEQRRCGKWIRGRHAGRSGTAVAYRAGHLMTTDDDGSQQSGEPEDFITVEGQSGEALLEELLPFPKIESFYYGAIREAIASAHFHAVSGGWYGDVNFADRGQYCCVDNQQGEDALIHFYNSDCVGVVSSGDPTRSYDPAVGIRKAPSWCQNALEEIVAKHEQWFCRPATGLFWSEGDRITGHEPFRVLYCYGFETMEELRLPDRLWIANFGERCESTLQIAKAITTVAKQYCETRRPVAINVEDLETIFPKNAPARAEAIKAVTTTEFAIIISLPK